MKAKNNQKQKEAETKKINLKPVNKDVEIKPKSPTSKKKDKKEKDPV